MTDQPRRPHDRDEQLPLFGPEDTSDDAEVTEQLPLFTSWEQPLPAPDPIPEPPEAAETPESSPPTGDWEDEPLPLSSSRWEDAPASPHGSEAARWEDEPASRWDERGSRWEDQDTEALPTAAPSWPEVQPQPWQERYDAVAEEDAEAERWESDRRAGVAPPAWTEEHAAAWDNGQVAPDEERFAEPPEETAEPERELVAVGGGVGPDPVADAKRKKISGAGLIIGVLLALLGFSLVVQVKSNSTDAAYASAREGDLLQIMSDLDGAERRLEQDIASLEASKRELQSGAAGQEAAQAAAKARADDMGILAGTLPAQGPGVQVVLTEVTGTIKAASLLNAVQELRGGGAEAILIDATGGSVRVIASTSFVDDNGGINVDGTRLTGPFTILAIGEPDTLSDAVQFAGGVVPRVKEDGGNVIVNKRDLVEIKEVRPAPDLEYARPAS